METTILILSITLLVLVAANLMLLVADLRLKNLIKSLRDKISDLEKKVVNHDLIIPGEKITFKAGLVFGKTTEFSVIYEGADDIRNRKLNDILS